MNTKCWHYLFYLILFHRSVHGFSDTDLFTLINNLKNEENQLCAHRGLVPGTIEQNFIVSVTQTFRTFYEKFYTEKNFVNSSQSSIPVNIIIYIISLYIYMKM